MANEEHLIILKQGVMVWNEWRNKVRGIIDLSYADLTQIDLTIDYPGPPPGYVDTWVGNFIGANLREVDLRGANLSNRNLFNVSFSRADLSEANLSGAIIYSVNFLNTGLRQTNLTSAHVSGTKFLNTDLSRTKGLESITHHGPSFIDINTLYRSAGQIPETFLRGCGVPDDFITYIPSLIDVQQAIQFYSCFISYSHKDEDFAERLHSRLRDGHIRVWFAPEDIKGGEKLYDQIERAIQMHDRLLLVLSENSMQSEWVITEIRNARKIEIQENRRKLFPIRLVDFEAIRKWKCFDAETGKDLATEIREYFIPDFSNWSQHDGFETAFERLLQDLKAEAAGERNVNSFNSTPR